MAILKITKLNCLANLQKQLIALLGIHVKQISIGLQYSSASNSLPPVSDVEELLIFRATPFFNVLSLCFRFKRIFRLILFIFDEVVFLQFFGTSSFKSSTACFLLFWLPRSFIEFSLFSDVDSEILNKRISDSDLLLTGWYPDVIFLWHFAMHFVKKQLSWDFNRW